MTTNSKTDICNLAADLLSAGVMSNIESSSPTATEALFFRWYDISRQKVLREHPWKFATKRAILARSSIDPEFGYTSAFPLPFDFIRLLTIESSEGQLILPADYQLESHNGVLSVLLSIDASSVRLRYVYDIEDVIRFDAMFINYLALDIALSVAFKITESNTAVERVAQLRKQQASMAKAISGQERPPTRIERSQNKAFRRGSSSNYAHKFDFN